MGIHRLSRASFVLAAAVLTILPLASCGAEGGAPEAAPADVGIDATVDGEGCVTFNADRVTVDELTRDAEAGFAASEVSESGSGAYGEAAEAVAQMAAFGTDHHAKYTDGMEDGSMRSFTQDLCDSDAYDRDIAWLRGQGIDATSVDDTVRLYDVMRSHPGLVVTTMGFGTCMTVEMFGEQLDTESLTQSGSPLQGEVAKLALRYICPGASK